MIVQLKAKKTIDNLILLHKKSRTYTWHYQHPLFGENDFGDCMDDEWKTVEIGRLLNDKVQLLDEDGDFVLIESSDIVQEPEQKTSFILDGKIYYQSENQVQELDTRAVDERIQKVLEPHTTRIKINKRAAQLLQADPFLVGYCLYEQEPVDPVVFVGEQVEASITLDKLSFAELEFTNRDLSQALVNGLELLYRKGKIPTIDRTLEYKQFIAGVQPSNKREQLQADLDWMDYQYGRNPSRRVRYLNQHKLFEIDQSVHQDTHWLEIDPNDIQHYFESNNDISKLDQMVDQVKGFVKRESEIHGIELEESDEDEPVILDPNAFLDKIHQLMGEDDGLLDELDQELEALGIEKNEDSDLNLAKHMIQSLESEQGSGPTSTLLQSFNQML